MKILHVNCVYQKGSTGKIVNEIHSELQRRSIDSVVCYGRGEKKLGKNIYKFCKEFEANIHTLIIRTGLFLNYGGLFIPTIRLKRIIDKESPDIVHLHCLNGSIVNIYRLLKWLAKKNIKTVVTHHAEFYYTGSCDHAYTCKQFTYIEGCQHCPIKFRATRSKTLDNSGRAWRSMKRAFSYFKQNQLIFIAVSPWLKERSKLSPIVNNFNCEVVMNGVNVDIFKYINEENIIMKRIRNNKKKICLFVGAYFDPQNRNDNKGGWYIFELAKQMPDVLFVIVSLRNINCNKTPDNVYIWGPSKGQEELASLYRSSDVTIVTSRRETFSMVCAESLCCGTPVVGFKAGGPESISLKKFSYFVNYADLTALQDSVETMLRQDFLHNEISEEARNVYSSKVMTDNYIDIYNKLYKL